MRRLREEISKHSGGRQGCHDRLSINARESNGEEGNRYYRCMAAFSSTDLSGDKARIETTKDGLIYPSYVWVLSNDDSTRWYRDPNARLLWVRGVTLAKGKTMLPCGIMNEIKSVIFGHQGDGALLSYFFFCQATDERLDTATAILRRIIYLLICQQPANTRILTYKKRMNMQAGEHLFKDVHSWEALSKIFLNILNDPHLPKSYIIIDALDECTSDQRLLLDFISSNSATTKPHVKRIISSRNWPIIEEYLNATFQLSLELNKESVSSGSG
jgi:hypothetical protein